jgi:hypothetical protein
VLVDRAQVAAHEAQPRPDLGFQPLAQLQRPLDHGRRRIQSDHAAVNDAPRQFDGILAAAASQIDYPFRAPELQAMENRFERFGAIAPETTVKFGIPISHGAPAGLSA